MKYIDADKLKQEIEKRFWAYGTHLHDDEVTTKADEILSFIDSLQQVQPDFPTTDEQMKEFLATHPKIKVPEKYKNPDWLFKKQEKPEVDLEKEIAKENEKWTCYEEIGFGALYDARPFDGRDIDRIARHFYELGRLSNK